MIDVKCSPNYNDIVNFLYEDNSVISNFIISYYQEYLSSIKSKKSKEKLDLVLKEYIKKEEFYKYVQKHFDIEETNKLFDNYIKVMQKMYKLYRQYEDRKYKQINNTRWL